MLMDPWLENDNEYVTMKIANIADMTGTVRSSLVIWFFIIPQAYMIKTIIPILKMGKLRHMEIKQHSY